MDIPSPAPLSLPPSLSPGSKKLLWILGQLAYSVTADHATAHRSSRIQHLKLIFSFFPWVSPDPLTWVSTAFPLERMLFCKTRAEGVLEQQPPPAREINQLQSNKTETGLQRTCCRTSPGPGLVFVTVMCRCFPHYVYYRSDPVRTL